MRQSTVRLLALAFALGFIFQATKSTAASSAAPTKWAVLTFDTTQTMIVYDLTGWPHVTHGTFKLRQGISGSILPTAKWLARSLSMRPAAAADTARATQE
jgi:Na+-transporting NADH:ubiquinone oxidoreductase subunit NqrB